MGNRLKFGLTDDRISVLESEDLEKLKKMSRKLDNSAYAARQSMQQAIAAGEYEIAAVWRQKANADSAIKAGVLARLHKKSKASPQAAEKIAEDVFASFSENDAAVLDDASNAAGRRTSSSSTPTSRTLPLLQSFPF